MSDLIVPQKQCTKCKEWFPATPEYFYRHKKSRDGLYYSCKTCKDGYRHTPEGREVVKRKVEKWRKTENGLAFVRAKYQRRDELLPPEKREARERVNLAVSSGKLPRVKNCSCFMCGGQADEYHHWSYKPEHYLDVIPLCQICHSGLHRMRSDLRAKIEVMAIAA